MVNARRPSLPVRAAAVVAVISGFALSPLTVARSQEPEPLAVGANSVLTRNYNNQRTGANLMETTLNLTNVTSGGFRKLFQVAVDDQVYAGILYASGVVVGGQTRNVIYVATVNNTLYAFNADTFGPPLWQRNFNGSGRPTRNSDVGSNCGTYRDFSGNIGIVSTPVIDGGNNAIYFVTRTIDSDGVTRHRLRNVDITTGNDRSPGSAVLSPAGFSATLNNQRAALALSQGVVYVGWSSFCDTGDYKGIFAGYNASSLAQTGVFNVTPTPTGTFTRGGIWMAGAGPAIDGNGSLYLSTGNGDWNGTSNFGESVLKLAPSTLGRQSFFTPSNWMDLNSADNDLGSAGLIFIPGTNLLVTGGKGGGTGFLLNSANLGGQGGQLQAWQAVSLSPRPSNTHHIHNSMVTWASSAGTNVYVWGENDFLRAYRFNAGTQRIDTPNFATGMVLPPVGMPGGMMTLSADGSSTSTGILWATIPRNGDANQAVVPGVLHAFDASNLALRWSSSTNPEDDTMNFSKGSPPVVANGKVYLASLSNVVSVYGLSGTVSNQNLARNRAATGSAPCAAGEEPAKAFNGTYAGGNLDKWCSLAAGTKFLQVDLGSTANVSQVIIEHAGAGGEALSLNTRAYTLQTSTDGTNFTQVGSMTANIQSITTHNLNPTPARFVRLNITTPTQTTDGAARIYEMKVYGSAGGPATLTFEAESLTVGATSGDLHRVASDASYSGGLGTILEGNAVNDFVTYNVNVPTAATYEVRVRIKRLNNRGIFQLSTDGSNLGPTVDGFATAASFPEISLGTRSFTTGSHTFRLTLTGRNASSTNFWTALDFIRLVPQ
jgi:F5/8 type C domain